MVKASSRRATPSAKRRQRLNPLTTCEQCEAGNWHPTEDHSAMTSNLHTCIVSTRCSSGKHLREQDAEALKDWKRTLKWSGAEAAASSATEKVRTLLVWSGEVYRGTEWGFRSQRAGWGGSFWSDPAGHYFSALLVPNSNGFYTSICVSWHAHWNNRLKAPLSCAVFLSAAAHSCD